VANGNGFDTLVLLINTGTTDASYSLQFFNQSGTAVTYALDPTQSGMTGTIKAGSQAIVRTTGAGATTSAGWGQLTAPPAINGMLIYQQQASPTSFQEGSAPFTTPSQHFFIPLDNANGAITAIGFVNPSASGNATVNFTIHYASGGTDMVPAVNMNPMQQIAETVSSLWPAAAGQRGMLEVNSNTPLGMVAFRFQGSAFTLFDTIAPTAGGTTPITSTIAHTADGNGFQSTFILTNSGTVPAPYTLSILGPTGQTEAFHFDVPNPLSGTIPAGSTLTLNTLDVATVTTLGWAQLSAPSAVSGLEVFGQTNPGKSEQEATIPITQNTLTHAFLPFDNAGNTTSIALTNPDPAITAAINFTFRYVDGSSSTGVISLLPNNYEANQLAALFSATAGKAGVAEITSNTGIAVVEVRFNPTQAFTSLRAVVPMAGQQGIAERALAQTGLAIGLASSVLQSQYNLLLAELTGAGGCSVLTGGGSIMVSGSSDSPTATAYYDNNCQKPYIMTQPGTTLLTGSGLGITVTETYFGLNGQGIGSLTLTESIQLGGSTVDLYGLGTFTPTTGQGIPIQLGTYCAFNSYISTAPCAGGIAQDFPALGYAIGAVTPLTLTGNFQSTGPVNFTGGGSTVTGPIGSLVLTNPSPTSLVIQGGAAYSTTTATGSTGAFELFPPPPTTWTIADSAHDQQFQISLSATRILMLTITQVSTGAVLSTGTLDQSGSGSISYSDGTVAVITNWTLSD